MGSRCMSTTCSNQHKWWRCGVPCISPNRRPGLVNTVVPPDKLQLMNQQNRSEVDSFRNNIGANNCSIKLLFHSLTTILLFSCLLWAHKHQKDEFARIYCNDRPLEIIYQTTFRRKLRRSQLMRRITASLKGTTCMKPKGLHGVISAFFADEPV